MRKYFFRAWPEYQLPYGSLHHIKKIKKFFQIKISVRVRLTRNCTDIMAKLVQILGSAWKITKCCQVCLDTTLPSLEEFLCAYPSFLSVSRDLQRRLVFIRDLFSGPQRFLAMKLREIEKNPLRGRVPPYLCSTVAPSEPIT